MQNRVTSCLFSFVVELANGFKMGGGGGGVGEKNSSTKNTTSSLLVASSGGSRIYKRGGNKILDLLSLLPHIYKINKGGGQK